MYCDSDGPVALSPRNGTGSVEPMGGRMPVESGGVAPSPPAAVRTRVDQSDAADASGLVANGGDVAPPNISTVLAFARWAETRAVPVKTAFARATRTSASASSRCSEAPGTYAPTVPMLRPSPRLRELLPRRNDSA